MSVKKKIVILLMLVLVFIVPIYRLLQRIEINFYFRTHYDQAKYQMELTDYYETGNLSGITDIVEQYGVTFPAYVYTVKPINNAIEDIPETLFYIGTNGFEIWDTYEISQLEYRHDSMVDDILFKINGVEDATTCIRVSNKELKNMDLVDIDTVYKILKLDISGIEMDKEKLIETIEEVNRSLEENSIYINRFRVSVYIGEDTRFYWFDYDELKSGELLNILNET